MCRFFCSRVLLVALTLAAFVRPAAAQFSGTFTALTETGTTLTLTLRQDGDEVAGSLFGDGKLYQIEGRIENETLAGSMRAVDGWFFFEADRLDEELTFAYYGTDARGLPDYRNYDELRFMATSSALATPAPLPFGGNPLAGPGAMGNPLAAGGDPFVGMFSDGNVILRLAGAGGQYQGQVVVGGQPFPIQATGGVGGLRGLIQGLDGAYDLTIQEILGGVLVVSGGQQYQLLRASQGIMGAPWWLAPNTANALGNGVGPGQQFGQGFTENHPMAREWFEFLRGSKLTRVESNSRARDGRRGSRTDLFLCSNGSFALRGTGSGGAFGGAGAATNSQGQWLVVTNGQVVSLILDYANGGRLELDMEQRGGETYANGDPVDLTPAGICS